MGLELPPLVKYEQFGSDEEFLTVLYEYFKEDFVYSKPKYNNKELWLKRIPIRDGREATFYHITTKGENEECREIDVPRAERLRWIRPLIESKSKDVLIWENNHRKEENILIFYAEKNFLIVLRKRKKGIIFWTAYCVEACYKKKLLKEYNNYCSKKLKTPFI